MFKSKKVNVMHFGNIVTTLRRNKILQYAVGDV